MKIFLLSLLIYTTYAQGDIVSEFKPWTRAEDNKTLSASFVSFNKQKEVVTLKLESGKIIEINTSVLIPEHRSRLENLIEKVEAPSKPLMESFTLKEGGEKIHVYKPAAYTDASSKNDTRPIAFLFSPSGKSLKIVDRLKPAADELGWILVGIDAYSNKKSQKNSSQVMTNSREAFDWAKKNISFDSNRIVFGGMSGGGWWSYQSASQLTTKAAGILAFGGWMSNMYHQKYSRGMAVALVNGDKDKGALLYEEKDSAFLEKKTKAKVQVFHFPGGHVLAPADIALKAARWIHETKEF